MLVGLILDFAGFTFVHCLMPSVLMCYLSYTDGIQGLLSCVVVSLLLAVTFIEGLRFFFFFG